MELRSEIRDFIKRAPHDRVLDVGSGPESILTGVIPRGCLTAFDKDAESFYDKVDYDNRPDVSMPLSWGVEDMPADHFFDIVHTSNVLANCLDAKAGYIKLFNSLKPGGFLIIHGECNNLNDRWGFTLRKGFPGDDSTQPLMAMLCCIDNSTGGTYFRLGNSYYWKRGDNYFIWIIQNLQNSRQ